MKTATHHEKSTKRHYVDIGILSIKISRKYLMILERPQNRTGVLYAIEFIPRNQ
jgi:hypothetical protein